MEQTFHYTIFAYSIFFKGFVRFSHFITYLLPICYLFCMCRLAIPARRHVLALEQG